MATTFFLCKLISALKKRMGFEIYIYMTKIFKEEHYKELMTTQDERGKKLLLELQDFNVPTLADGGHVEVSQAVGMCNSLKHELHVENL